MKTKLRAGARSQSGKDLLRSTSLSKQTTPICWILVTG